MMVDNHIVELMNESTWNVYLQVLCEGKSRVYDTVAIFALLTRAEPNMVAQKNGCL